MLQLNLSKLCQTVEAHDGLRTSGKLRSSNGVLLTCTLPAAVGDRCLVETPQGRSLLGEVIGFKDGVAYLVLYEDGADVHPGMAVIRQGSGLVVPVGEGLLGRIVDGLGRPIDGQGPLTLCRSRPVRTEVPPALDRRRIREKLVTGQRALDGLLTLGRGQRVGIFAGSGVGKSTLLGEIAKGSDADINVIALVGERGREVRPFIDDCVGPEGMKKSVVLVATGDQTPLLRIRAAQAAITIADSFREQGAHVLLMLDSLTRLAMAQRELGLALGEPPSARSYTPSVFRLLATLIERLGNDAHGSITGILTILVEGGDLDEPVSDAVRSLVDGHIVLDRRLAERGHYPAINISQSISRVAPEVTDVAHQTTARKLTAILGTYMEVEDLIRIGAYVKGTSPQADRAIDLHPALMGFLKQQINERMTFAETRVAMEQIAAGWPF